MSEQKQYTQEYVQGLLTQIVDLKAEMEFGAERETERLNEFWALVYPDDPTGWEYPAQVWRHVRDLITEQQERINSLQTEMAQRVSP